VLTEPTPDQEPADDDSCADPPTLPAQRGFWRRHMCFRRGERRHNTAVVVAWIGFAGALGGPLVTVVGPALWTHLMGQGGHVPHHRMTTIVNAPNGITYAYQQPNLASEHAKKRATYREGDTIEVVCQIRDGESISMPGDGRPLYAVSVWDKLPNGSWVPDIFTSLEHKRGPKPPPGIELCPAQPSALVP
jgi:hypothetical protein